MVWYDPLCCQPITQVEATTGMKYTGFNYMMFTNNQFSDVVCAISLFTIQLIPLMSIHYTHNLCDNTSKIIFAY